MAALWEKITEMRLFLLFSLSLAKTFIYNVENEVVLKSDVPQTDSNLCQIRDELEKIVCEGFGSCDVTVDKSYDANQCADFDEVLVFIAKQLQ